MKFEQYKSYNTERLNKYFSSLLYVQMRYFRERAYRKRTDKFDLYQNTLNIENICDTPTKNNLNKYFS